MPEIVEINELPMQEAHNQAEINDRFKQLVAGEIPAFVLRGAGYDIDLTGIGTSVAEAAKVATGQDHVAGPPLPFRINPSEGKTDVGLHADNKPNNDDPLQFHLHTTTEGSAKVSTAKPGPHLKTSAVNERAPEELIGHFKNGRTDRSLMDADAHTTIVNKGDTVVFPISGTTPAWHNFDTIGDGERAAAVATLTPKPAEKPKFKPDDEGD